MESVALRGAVFVGQLRLWSDNEFLFSLDMFDYSYARPQFGIELIVYDITAMLQMFPQPQEICSKRELSQRPQKLSKILLMKNSELSAKFYLGNLLLSRMIQGALLTP